MSGCVEDMGISEPTRKEIHRRLWFNPYKEVYFMVRVKDGELDIKVHDNMPPLGGDDSWVVFKGRIRGGHRARFDAKDMTNTVLFMCPPCDFPHNVVVES
jgi:hypothetical protein